MAEEKKGRKYGISMKQWSASMRKILPPKFDWIPHNTYLKFLRMTWLTVFCGFSVREALSDCDMSSGTFYKANYKDFRKWLKGQALDIRAELDKGRSLKSALPKSAREKLSDIVWSIVVDKSEDFEKLQNANKEKSGKIKNLTRKVWKLKGKEEAVDNMEKDIEEEKEVLEEARERVEEGGSFLGGSEEWQKYLEKESEEK